MTSPSATYQTTADPVAPGGSRAAVATEVIRSFDERGIDPDAWNSLVATSGGTVYQTYEWQSLWWKSYGGGKTPHILLFRSDGAVVGIAPFFSSRAPFSGVNRLRFIGSGDAFGLSGGVYLDDGPSDYLGLIIAPGYGTAVGEALLGHLIESRPGIAGAEMVNLRPDGDTMKHVVPILSGSAQLRVTVSRGDVCSQIAVAAPVTEFIRSLGSGVRRRYNQASRLIGGAETGLTLRTIDRENWDTLYGDLVVLHQARWQRAGFPGLFHRRANAGFQGRIARALFDRGWLWFSSLYDGDRCVAARLGFSYGGRMYDYLSGFDDASPWAKKRPGMALLLKMYQDAFSAGMTTVDLLRGDEAYKAELTDDQRTLRNVIIETDRHPGGLATLASRLSGAAGLASFQAQTEWQLFRVHVSRHGPIGGATNYLGFRLKRLTRKIHSRKDHSTND